MGDGEPDQAGDLGRALRVTPASGSARSASRAERSSFSERSGRYTASWNQAASRTRAGRHGLEEVDRLVQLAEDLLVVARSEGERLALVRERLSVAELLAAVAERFEARASESGRALRVLAPGELTIEADRLRIEQALTSVVNNAFRHGEGEVRLWPETVPGEVRLHVGDRGQGFPPEFLAHAFERFTRADAARGRGGTGLGLAIVETIAVAHGGSAGAVNDAAGGADVWIAIPST